jgi:hypothetical protein
MLSKKALTGFVFEVAENLFGAEVAAPWVKKEETSTLTDKGIFIPEKGGQHL